MTCIYDDPEVFATTAIAGFSSVYARTVRAVSGGVIRSTATPEGKVALVIGGGSGHFPAFAGFVGPGLADAAVAGMFSLPRRRTSLPTWLVLRTGEEALFSGSATMRVMS